MAFDTISNQINDALIEVLNGDVQDEFATLEMPAMAVGSLVDEGRMKPEEWPALYLVDLNEVQRYGDATINGAEGKQNTSGRYDIVWVVKASAAVQDVARWAVAVGDVVRAALETDWDLGGLVYDVNVDSLETTDPISSGSALIARGRAAITVLFQRTLTTHGAEA